MQTSEKRPTIGRSHSDPGATKEFVHELTHVIQYVQNRPLSEVETTQNEIDLMTELDPYYVTKLKPIEK